MPPTYGSGVQSNTTMQTSLENRIDIVPEIFYLEEDLTPLVHLAFGKGSLGGDGGLGPVKTSVCGNPQFRMFEKEPHEKWCCVNNGSNIAPAATTVAVDDSQMLIPGMVLQPVGTGELLYVRTVPNTISFTCTRSLGPTAADTILDNTPLLIVGFAGEDGSNIPTIKKVLARYKDNYCQIFEEAWGVTRPLMNSENWTGDKRSDLRKEGWLEFKKKMERAFLFSEPSESAGVGINQGRTVWTTGGAYYWIGTVAGRIQSVATTLTKSAWATFNRNTFRYGSRRKVYLCAPWIIDALEYWKDNNLQFRPADEVYGLRVAEWETGHGTALIMRDVELENSALGLATGYGYTVIALDWKNLHIRHLKNDDPHLMEDVKKDGIKETVDQIYGQVGLGITNPETGNIMKVTGATPVYA